MIHSKSRKINSLVLAIFITLLIILLKQAYLKWSGGDTDDSIQTWGLLGTANFQLDFNQTKLKELQVKRNYAVHHASLLKVTASPWSIKCDDGNGSLILVYVHTRMSAVHRRDQMRSTWANRSLFPSIQTVFVVGSSLNTTLNGLVLRENSRHGDMIQGSFMDTYRNLTFKSLAAWQWMLENCHLEAKVRAVIKIDDDVLINVPLLLSDLREGRLVVREKTSTCTVLYRSPVIRDPKSPVYTSFDEYPFRRSRYEPYCGGSHSIVASDLIGAWYEKAWLDAGHKFDDVYVGMLSNRVRGHRFVHRPRMVTDLAFLTIHTDCYFISSIKSHQSMAYEQAWQMIYSSQS
jgi:hypothetical protein